MNIDINIILGLFVPISFGIVFILFLRVQSQNDPDSHSITTAPKKAEIPVGNTVPIDGITIPIQLPDPAMVHDEEYIYSYQESSVYSSRDNSIIIDNSNSTINDTIHPIPLALPAMRRLSKNTYNTTLSYMNPQIPSNITQIPASSSNYTVHVNEIPNNSVITSNTTSSNNMNNNADVITAESQQQIFVNAPVLPFMYATPPSSSSTTVDIPKKSVKLWTSDIQVPDNPMPIPALNSPTLSGSARNSSSSTMINGSAGDRDSFMQLGHHGNSDVDLKANRMSALSVYHDTVERPEGRSPILLY
jgi:hypothetical protein